MLRTHLFLLIATGALIGCGSTPTGPTTPTTETPREVHEMEELRLAANRNDQGEIEVDVFDAETLFREGLALVREGQCLQGVAKYDRVATEFPSSRFAPAALYNSGLCLTELGPPHLETASTHFASLVSRYPESEDVKHSRFQLAYLYPELERFEPGLAVADLLLEDEGLDVNERIEAQARRAQCLLGLGRRAPAREQARATLRYARREDERGERVENSRPYQALANYVVAETFRLDSEDVEIPPGTVQEQHTVLESRARLILNAQHQYFNTIGFRVPHWSASAGHRIGEMYETFWNAITSAPVPPPTIEMSESDIAVYEEEFRLQLALLVKPLIRHAIRYWELTLLMVEQQNADPEWLERIRGDLGRARERLLQQPEGEGGLPEQAQHQPEELRGTLSGALYEDMGVGPADITHRITRGQITLRETGDENEPNPDTGFFQFRLPPGTYTVAVEVEGFHPSERTCQVRVREDSWCTIGLRRRAGTPPTPDATAE